MHATLDQLEAEAMQLNQQERADLAERLLESLASSTSDHLQQAWTQAALRRRDEIRSGKVVATPGPEGLAMVRSLVAP